LKDVNFFEEAKLRAQDSGVLTRIPSKGVELPPTSLPVTTDLNSLYIVHSLPRPDD
jgi:hypothetical protein